MVFIETAVDGILFYLYRLFLQGLLIAWRAYAGLGVLLYFLV